MLELPRELLNPEAYPDPRPQRVTLAATHASWVLLTDHEAWKLKRPVNFGFLDFSTPQKRRACCEEEQRLGARLAPGVYGGVVPVYRGPRGLSFRPPGEIVDHALRMRRLDDADSAAALLEAGKLTPSLLTRLCRRLARFYAEAAPCPDAGSPAVFAANVAENQVQIRSLLPPAEARLAEEICRWQQGVLAARESELCARLTDERVRDGHGDLRLEHVYFPDQGAGEPLVIDPIEFNRRFRCTDVALDVAFLAMELEAAGRRDLAAHVMSTFARESNDYGFWSLLDLYVSYRAFVRAKVAAFVAADPVTPAKKAARKREEAGRLLRLAAACRRPARTRAVVVVSGLVGAGKSTLAEALCRELEMPVVSSDATRKHLGRVPALSRGGPQLYTPEFTQRTYREVLHRAEQVLVSGRGVILDATFKTAQHREAATALARDHELPILFIDLTCDPGTLRERVRTRAAGPSLSDADEAVLTRMLAEPPQEPPGPGLPPSSWLRLDGRSDPTRSARAVRERLSCL